MKAEFVIRAQHFNRIIEVYKHQLDHWEREVLQDLVDSLPLEVRFQVAFTHASSTKITTMHLGWLRIYLSDAPDESLWVLIA